jgi:hypothetical protein
VNCRTRQFTFAGSEAAAAQGIAAEILFYREAVKKIGAESPVFAAQPQKCAQIPDYTRLFE